MKKSDQACSNAALHDEVEQLRSEVQRLNAAIEELRAREHSAETACCRIGRTEAANAARIARAAELDAKIVEVMKVCLAEFVGPIDARTDLRYFGFPHFHSQRRIRHRIANRLNELGVPAPRGGKWQARQVYRALLRHAERTARS